jgi:predicted phosphoribosyltransferase
VIYRDRADAGRLLVRALATTLPEIRALPVTVLAIPRGGVPVGAEIAAALHAPLGVFIARSDASVRGRTVILVDDGLDTGATARAALATLAAEGPERLVFATPVASTEGIASLRALGVTAISAATPPHFRSIGEWYERFPKLDDQDVLQELQHANARA